MPLSFFLCHLHSVPVSILKLTRSWSNTPFGLQNTFCPPLLHMGEMVIYIYLNQRQDFFFWSCFQIWGICPAATRIRWRKVYQGCWFSQDCIRHAASKRLHSSGFPSFLKSTLIQSIGSESWPWTRHCAGAIDKQTKKKNSLWCPDYSPTWKAFHRVTIKTLWERGSMSKPLSVSPAWPIALLPSSPGLASVTFIQFMRSSVLLRTIASASP